jgi:hypothetical protein
MPVTPQLATNMHAHAPLQMNCPYLIWSTGTTASGGAFIDSNNIALISYQLASQSKPTTITVPLTK